MPTANLLNSVQAYLPEDRYQFVVSALNYAKKCHFGQMRLSGDPYIEHPIATAEYLAEMQMDATTLAASLLHDVVEDCGVDLSVLAQHFGPEVSVLVDGVTKLKRLDFSDPDQPTALKPNGLRRPTRGVRARRLATNV